MISFTCAKCQWSGEVPETRKRCRECERQYIKRWRAEHPDAARSLKARMEKKWRSEHREEYNAKRRRKRQRNKATSEAMYKRRQQWLLDGDVTREQLVAIYERYKGHCIYCQSKVHARFDPIHLRGFDHVRARANGGPHTASNLVVSCRKCNELKG